MIIEQEAGLALEKSHDFKQKRFSILDSAEAYEILSKGIYQDGIAAVIRELSTNAYDSHVQAEEGVMGEDGEWIVKPIPNRSMLPFDITLPSYMSPIFKIRDYGTGLSEDDIMSTYNTYFFSSKRKTNTQIGSKGLGSKSPYSIVSSFLIISYFNGVKTGYNAVKEDKIPTVIKLQSEPTDEPN